MLDEAIDILLLESLFVQILSACKQLKQVSLSGNPIVDDDDYHNKALSTLPQITVRRFLSFTVLCLLLFTERKEEEETRIFLFLLLLKREIVGLDWIGLETGFRW